MTSRKICKAYFTEAGCPETRRSCRFRHDGFICSCGAITLNSSKRQHMAGKRHLKFLQQEGKKRATATPAEPSIEEDRTEKCTICQRIISAVEMAAHVAEHERQDRIEKMKEELAKAEEDKGGIGVDNKEGVDFGVVEAGSADSKEVNISKIDGQWRVKFINCFMRSSLDNDAGKSPFSVIMAGRVRNITKPRSVLVVFAPSYAGYYEDTLELVFAHSGGQFVITRRISGIAGSCQDQEDLKPKEPYKKKKYVPLQFDGPVIPNPRPPVWSGVGWVNILSKFDPPKDLIDAAFKKTSIKAVKRLIPSVFNAKTYGAYFQALLYIEGVQNQMDLDRLYTQKAVSMEKNSARYDLEIQGVSIGRPSVRVGDYIHARRSEDPQDASLYQGRVHAINGDVLNLYFSEQFRYSPVTKYDIRFTYNRVPERRKHQAVSARYKPMRALFPDNCHIEYGRVTQEEIRAVNAINRDIGQNDEQLEAIAAILKQPPGSVPFVIFGPPGTGKTVTIVEAMRQILLADSEARILACAPSNTAADTITTHLKVLGQSQLFRLNSMTRPLFKLDKALRPFSLLNDNEVFAIPELDEIKKFRVVVSTCISAGVLWGLGLRKGHFTHIFVDEAGQSEEPEIMVPFLTLADNSTNLILAGDPQQLGPEIDSRIAKSFGLGKSYLSRLMARDIYEVEYGRGLTVVKLLENFRSHPSILEFSNTQFYNSELKACGDPVVTHSLENIDELPKKGFPVVFHGVIGKDQREKSSPSYFNIDEVTIVKKYCQDLISNRKKRIKPEDIGVITPYHNQKCKIQQLLYREDKLKGIKVGSVDEFQGQEYRIIILSTVRSTPDHLALDIKRSLGFVASPLRLNVAMTRARALLIVVGNPTVLSLDPLWRSFLNYVYKNGGWKGATLKWNYQDPTDIHLDSVYRERAEAEMEDTITRLRAMVSQNLREYGINFEDENDSDDEPYNAADERGMARDDD